MTDNTAQKTKVTKQQVTLCFDGLRLNILTAFNKVCDSIDEYFPKEDDDQSDFAKDFREQIKNDINELYAMLQWLYHIKAKNFTIRSLEKEAEHLKTLQ